MQVHEEEVGVVFWEANAVDLHNALQIIRNEFSQREGLLHRFALPKPNFPVET